jgi:hypothetical protein
MHFYRERLYAPPLWWVAGITTMLMFGAITVAFLVNWGRATIEVTPGELRAGTATLPLAMAGEVSALDEAQARILRGPRADPTAYMLIRPYLRYAVYIEVSGKDPASPYWLVQTRHPAELAAAIERSRPVVSPGGVAMT